MKELTSKQKYLSYIFQVIASLILAKASYLKFIGDDMTLTMFNALGIEETRLIIASIEAIAAILLITNNIPHYGAILGFGTMMGALIAHVTVLGIEVNGDGGMLVIMLAMVVISTSTIMWIRRRSLPLIGHTFD